MRFRQAKKLTLNWLRTVYTVIRSFALNFMRDFNLSFCDISLNLKFKIKNCYANLKYNLTFSPTPSTNILSGSAYKDEQTPRLCI